MSRVSRRLPTPARRTLRAASDRLPAPARRVLRRVLRRPDGSGRKHRRQTFLAGLDRRSVHLPLPPAGAITAAAALSPRLRAALGGEWHLLDLAAEDWSTVAADSAPDLVLLEWTAEGVPGLAEEAVAAVLDSARGAGTPVLVWATECRGRPWPEGRSVARADQVFADDPATAAAWTEQSGRTVRVLPAAASPYVHSPARTGSTTRREQAVGVLSADAGHLLPFAQLPPAHVDVWLPLDSERPTAGAAPDPSAGHGAGTGPAAPATAEGVDDPRTLERLHALTTTAVVRRSLDGTRPELGHYRVVTAVRGGHGSAWPLVEASMAGTPLVLDTASAALLPADLREVHTVAVDDTELRLDTSARVWQRELVEREGLVAARAARSGHSISLRARDLAAAAGLDTTPTDRSVSVVVPTNRPHELDNVIANVARQHETTLGHVQLVLVLHGLDVDEAELRRRLEDAGIGQGVVLHADRSLTLGSCMNLGVDAADGRFIAKVDDDNYYGAHYLTDLVDAFTYSGAGIVGKWCHYIWLRSSGAVLLRNRHSEYRNERLVQGGAMVLDREVVRELRFSDIPRAVDTDILGRARDAGVGIFSADRFNFVSVRGTDRHAHTWPISDTALMNRAGELAFFGDPRQHVEV
jgi:Glycosyl transferase family 2